MPSSFQYLHVLRKPSSLPPPRRKNPPLFRLQTSWRPKYLLGKLLARYFVCGVVRWSLSNYKWKMREGREGFNRRGGGGVLSEHNGIQYSTIAPENEKEQHVENITWELLRNTCPSLSPVPCPRLLILRDPVVTTFLCFVPSVFDY